MSRLKVVGFALGAIVLLALGVLFAIDGDAVLATMTLAFGAVCAGGALLMRRPSAPEEPVGPGAVTLGDRRLEGLVIPFSSRRVWIGVLMCAGFVVMGVAIALHGSVLIGALTAATFGVMGVLGVFNARRGAGKLVLGDESIAHVAAAGAAILRWEDVERWETYDIRGTPMFGLWGPAETHGMSQLFRGMSGKYGDLVIGHTAVGVDPEWLEDLIVRCIEDPAARREVAAGRVPAHPSG